MYSVLLERVTSRGLTIIKNYKKLEYLCFTIFDIYGLAKYFICYEEEEFK